MIRELTNTFAGRKKSLDERLGGLDGVFSLLKLAPDTLFEIKYNDKAKKYDDLEIHPENVINKLSSFVEIYPNIKLECKHTIFSGKTEDKHYIDISKLHPTESGKYSVNRSVKIMYYTVKQ